MVINVQLYALNNVKLYMIINVQLYSNNCAAVHHK